MPFLRILVLSLLVVLPRMGPFGADPPSRAKSGQSTPSRPKTPAAWQSRPRSTLDMIPGTATHVVEGQVKSLRYLNDKGKADINGPRFSLSLTVKEVYKGRGLEPGRTVTLTGIRQGPRALKHIPKSGGRTTVHLQKTAAGYELLSFASPQEARRLALDASARRMRAMGNPPSAIPSRPGDEKKMPNENRPLSKSRTAKSAGSIRPLRSLQKVTPSRTSASVLDPKKRVEWELSSSVVEGRVKSFQRTDDDGKAASEGSRFVVTLSVGRVLKGSGVKSGDTLRLKGWVTGPRAQLHLPVVKEEVVAYLKKRRAGGLDLLFPSGFLSSRSGNMKQ